MVAWLKCSSSFSHCSFTSKIFSAVRKIAQSPEKWNNISLSRSRNRGEVAKTDLTVQRCLSFRFMSRAPSSLHPRLLKTRVAYWFFSLKPFYPHLNLYPSSSFFFPKVTTLRAISAVLKRVIKYRPPPEYFLLLCFLCIVVFFLKKAWWCPCCLLLSQSKVFYNSVSPLQRMLAFAGEREGRGLFFILSGNNR